MDGLEAPCPMFCRREMHPAPRGRPDLWPSATSFGEMGRECDLESGRLEGRWIYTLVRKKNKVGGMYPCVLCTMYRDIVVPVSKAVGSRESGALSLFWFSLHVWLRSMSQPPTGACPKFIQQLPAMKSRQLPIFFLALLIAPVFAVKEVGIRLCCPVLPVPACLVVPGPRRRAHTVLRYLEGPFFPLLLPFIPSLHFLRLPLPPRGLPDTTNAALQSLDTCGEVDDR